VVLCCLAVIAAVAGTAACTSATQGAGSRVPKGSSGGSAATSSASTPATKAPTTTGAVPTTSAAPSTHPVPATPLKTATVDASGRHYVLKVWADVQDDTCTGHAYGAPMIAFLAEHPCNGLDRRLVTTTVNGQDVGFDIASTSFAPGPQNSPYVNTAAFRTLVRKDGTGNFNDLLREGWRVPGGPTSVPSPDAFVDVGQDNGVSVYDIWYLSGPTPANDPELLRMAQDVYLQF
jgi:hypothetical protein